MKNTSELNGGVHDLATALSEVIETAISRW